MQKIRVDMSIERKLITLLVMNDEFITKIRPVLNPSDLATTYAKEVASWCLEFYDKFERAPSTAIQDIFIAKREYIPEDDTIKAIGEFLSKALDEYDEKAYDNLPYYINASETYLRRNSVIRLTEKVKAFVDVGDIDKAENMVANYHRIEVPSTQGISLLDDTTMIREAFNTEQELGFRFPGALGKVVGNMYLGDLIGWTAPFKAGKTWALLYSAEQAMLSGKRVLFISLEMRRDQLLRRAWQSLNGLPVKPGMYTLPKFIRDEDMWAIGSDTVKKQGIDTDNITSIQEKIRMMSHGGDIRYMCLPSKTTTVESIEVIIDNFIYYENYMPEVVIIDYADILGVAKTFRGGEYRHIMDDIWSNLRRVAQDRNILIITASQVNRGGLDAEELDAKNIAEDIRKAGHVAKLIGLSRTKDDREKNMSRVNMIYERDEQETYESAFILQQFALGRFHLDSRLSNEVDL